MSIHTKARRYQASILRQRQHGGLGGLLSATDFHFAAQCERMRVDRNGSTLSMLIISLSTGSSTGQQNLCSAGTGRRRPLSAAVRLMWGRFRGMLGRAATDLNVGSTEPGVDFLARVLEGRLRTTDTPGFLPDGRVAILLPDTPAEGAWVLATDLSEVYPPGPDRPTCEVVVYPTEQTQQAWEEEAVDDRQASEKRTSRSRRYDNGQLREEFFFAQALPAWKRCLDVCGAVVGLALTAPILLVAGLAIKLSSPGPVFFTQQREGLGGRLFNIWKLRTMCVNAEAQQHQLQEHSHQDGPAFKMKSDPRTTRVGKFLRRSSIDELPQFWNVLRGEMSLVGPRPLPIAESLACQNWQRRRLSVTPGLTCIWQVRSRGQVPFDEWVRMDLEYINKHGLWQDLKLLIATPPAVLLQKGIH